MNSATIQSEIGTLWGTDLNPLIGSLPTQWDNTEHSQSTPWARVSWQEDTGVRSSIGGDTDVRRMTGNIFIQLFEPYGSGDANLLSKADIILQRIEAVKNTTNVVFRTGRIRKLPKEGRWARLNIIIPWYSDTIL